MMEWEGLRGGTPLTVAAEIESDYDGPPTSSKRLALTMSFRGSVHYLERGETVNQAFR